MPLPPEEAYKRLQALADKRAPARMAGRVRRLRGDARHAATVLLPYHVRTPKDTDWRVEPAGAWLDAASKRARQKVFRALHPTLGDLLAATWTATATDPYTVGYVRRAFRAPSAPQVTHSGRVAAMQRLIETTYEYDRPAAWFAAWAPHIPGADIGIGRMLAVAMDGGDSEVRDVLTASLAGEHEIGMMGRHVVTALLTSKEPSDWDRVERLLLAAQRQEGLRSVILETVDLAQPEPFRRMLALVVEQGLARFASVSRAIGVWFGVAFDVRDRKTVDQILTDVAVLLDDAGAREAAIAGDDPSQVHLGLWATAYRDAMVAAARAAERLQHGPPDVRVAAARVLVDVQHLPAARALLPYLGDEDARIAALAVTALGQGHRGITGRELEAPTRALLARRPKATQVDVGILRSEPVTLDPAQVVARLLMRTEATDVAQVADLVERSDPTGRSAYVRLLARSPVEHRQRLLDLVGDRSSWVQRSVFEALEAGAPPTSHEAERIEALLTRKAAAVRRGALGLLLRQNDAGVLASVERLQAGTKLQASAAAELLRELAAAGRGGDAVQAPATSSEAAATAPSALVDHDRRTPAVQPTGAEPDLSPWLAGMELVVSSLDAWVAEHRDVEVTVRYPGASQVMLAADVRYLPTPDPTSPWEPQRGKAPLAELGDPWWERTQGQLTDGGVEALLVWASTTASDTYAHQAVRWSSMSQEPRLPRWYRLLTSQLAPASVIEDRQYLPTISGMLPWYAIDAARPSWIAPLLDLAEAALAAIPSSATAKLPTLDQVLSHRWDQPPLAFDWRAGAPLAHLQVALSLEQLRPELFDAQQRDRLWRCVRFVDEPQGLAHPAATSSADVPSDRAAYSGGIARERPLPRRPVRRPAPMALAVRAVTDGAADREDLRDLLATERWNPERTLSCALRAYWSVEAPLGDLTRRRRNRLLDDHPWVVEVVDDVRSRVVAIETDRGELPTLASAAAMQLRSVYGAATAVELLRALGNQSLVRGWGFDENHSKPGVLSHLIRVSFPAPGETPEDFAQEARRAKASEKRLLELAVYAPQWAPSVEHTLGWDGLAEGVHWLHAHTKDDRWHVDADVRDEWTAVTHEHTPLTADELLQGHVDVAWFERTLEQLGVERFERLTKAAKLASSSGGHKRAELFASALRGQVERAALDARIADKRHQDSVRALGLLPLPDGDEAARAEVLARYQQLTGWQRGSRNFGAQKRASESLAVDVAMANLARTAGYADPHRLRWAMEAEAIRDLAAGPVAVTEDDVTVTLSLSDDGTPRLEVVRGDRTLKSVPKAVAKREPIVELKARVTQLKGQTKRMRTSLEGAMVRGDQFTPDELAALLRHPTLAPMLRSLVLLTDDGRFGRPDAAPPPDTDGEPVLVDVDGVPRPLGSASLRIAHPVDLLASGRWHEWQRATFDGRLRQPFKQIFRELYVPTTAEQDGATHTQRYAGHQVAARQAVGIFGARGWVVDHEQGVTRTFHDDRLTVRVGVVDGVYTAVEAADMMLESVAFHPVGSWDTLALDDVPPRLFSEVMRDIDLVVSVAHSGGVDPEATASTVEMRAALVRETAGLLGLDNIELTDNHAMVTGTLGSYSVHLGSATVHRRPGNAICIVPVGAQHRGRLFLPFVDDDPRTAEVVSKVVLLARDHKIQDPTILEQLRV